MIGDGVAYLIHRGPRFCPVAAASGRLAPGGQYWDGTGWGPIATARYFTVAERDTVQEWAGILAGGKWLEVMVEIPAGEGR
jgi:hypothetical protein